MTVMNEKLAELLAEYNTLKTPANAIALADFLLDVTSLPYLVEDCASGDVDRFATVYEAREHGNTLLAAQNASEAVDRWTLPGANHRTRRLVIQDVQDHWQNHVK